MKEKISRLCVSREKITHIDEQSGKTVSSLEGRILAERGFIALA